MEERKALALINSIIDTHVEMLGGENTEAARLARESLANARQDLVLLVEQVIAECRDEVGVDEALAEAEEITRDAH